MSQSTKEQFSIRVGEKDLLAAITSRGQMINRSGKLPVVEAEHDEMNMLYCKTWPLFSLLVSLARAKASGIISLDQIAIRQSS